MLICFGKPRWINHVFEIDNSTIQVHLEEVTRRWATWSLSVSIGGKICGEESFNSCWNIKSLRSTSALLFVYYQRLTLVSLIVPHYSTRIWHTTPANVFAMTARLLSGVVVSQLTTFCTQESTFLVYELDETSYKYCISHSLLIKIAIVWIATGQSAMTTIVFTLFYNSEWLVWIRNRCCNQESGLETS